MAKDSAPKLTKYLLIAALLQLIWGMVPSASKFVIEEIPVELYIAIRWSISGLIFVAYLLAKKSWQRVSLRDFFGVSILGALGYGVASIFMLYGLKLGGVSNFALIGAVGPLIVSLVAIVVLRERPERLFYVALPISITGLALLVWGKNEISSLQIAGASAALILFGVFLEALVFIYSKRFRKSMNAIQYLAIAQVAAAALMWMAQGIYYRQASEIANLSPTGIAAALFVSLVACVLCYVVLYWLLNYIEGHRLALFDAFHALSGTIFGILFFGDELRPPMILGGALILTGLIAGNLPKNATTESPE